MTELDAFNAGFDCGMNGANTTNCHFGLFSSREMTAAWERGKRVANEQKSARPASGQLQRNKPRQTRSKGAENA